MSEASLSADRGGGGAWSARPAFRSGAASLAARVPRGMLRFLVAGGAISGASWLVRFPLSTVLPFAVAVAVTYGLGMVLGFELYRRWVFPGSRLPLLVQAQRFVAVNLAGMAAVIAGAAGLAQVLRPVLSLSTAEAAAHGLAIVAGAAVNYAGHRAISFARGRHA